jgi:hypothetical protein
MRVYQYPWALGSGQSFTTAVMRVNPLKACLGERMAQLIFCVIGVKAA